MHVASSTWGELPGPSRTVAREVLYRGPLSRAELARRLDLSSGSLTRLTRPLLQRGVLTEVGTQVEHRIGRPGVLLDVVPRSRHFIGIKLTGGEAHAVLTTLRAEVLTGERAPLPSRSPAAALGTMRELITSLGEQVADVAAVGVSFGGVPVDNATVGDAPFLGWHDVPLATMLTESTGLPTVLENDVVAVTEAEHWFGAGRHGKRLAVITIGTGVGYGLVMHDQVVNSPDVGIGLVSHLPLDPCGPVCRRGHRGCATAMLSIPAICSAVSVGLGRELGYEECLDLASAGDRVAHRVVTEAGRALGRFVALAANLTMPDKVIVTGDGIRLASVARDAMLTRLAEDRDPRAAPLDLDIQSFDFFEWARGAAAIAIQRDVLGELR